MDLKLVSRTLILAIAGGSFALTAFAQWQWIDKDGRKVYSDRSPSPDIPEKNVLKRPNGGRFMSPPAAIENPAASAPEVLSPSAAAAAARKASAPVLSGKDPQLEARKKQAEEEESAKKKVEEEKLAKAKAENCDRARKAVASLQSGVRTAVTNSKGERELLDDTARAAEIKRLQGVADVDCK